MTESSASTRPKNSIGTICAWLKLMLGNAGELLDQYGVFFLLKRFLAKAGFVHFFRSSIIIRQDIDQIGHNNVSANTFKLATVDDVIGDATFDICFFDKRKTLYRMSRGLRLFIAKEGSKIIFALWIEKDNASFWWLDIPLDLPPDMAYLSGVYTAPKIRNQGMYTTVRNQLYPLLKNEGIKSLITTIDPKNVLSLDIHRKFGWKEYQTITYRRLWHIRRYTVTEYNSSAEKTFITLLKAPRNIWRLFFQNLS